MTTEIFTIEGTQRDTRKPENLYFPEAKLAFAVTNSQSRL